MFSPSSRFDPFAAARHEAGLDRVDARPARTRRRKGAAAALALLTAVGAMLLTSVAPASGAPDEVSVRESALAEATAARVRAEQRVAGAQQRLDDAQQELEALGVVDEKLTEELAVARRKLREYAVAAYIDGGQTEILRSSLSPEKAAALAWQSNIALGQSASADEAAERFEQLKEANDPERLRAAAELDRLRADLEDASNDAIQASAHERDAEAALTTAREAAARAAEQRAAARREEEQRAEQRAAEQRAAARRTARQATAVTAPVAPSAPAAAPAAATSAPSGSTAAGNPTAWESSTLAKIRRCESGGNYSAVSASGRYRGAYQFDRSTWASVGGSGDPAAASPAEQDHRALILLRQRGTRPWPICGR